MVFHSFYFGICREHRIPVALCFQNIGNGSLGEQNSLSRFRFSAFVDGYDNYEHFRTQL